MVTRCCCDFKAFLLKVANYMRKLQLVVNVKLWFYWFVYWWIWNIYGVLVESRFCCFVWFIWFKCLFSSHILKFQVISYRVSISCDDKTELTVVSIISSSQILRVLTLFLSKMCGRVSSIAKFGKMWVEKREKKNQPMWWNSWFIAMSLKINHSVNIKDDKKQAEW